MFRYHPTISAETKGHLSCCSLCRVKISQGPGLFWNASHNKTVKKKKEKEKKEKTAGGKWTYVNYVGENVTYNLFGSLKKHKQTI